MDREGIGSYTTYVFQSNKITNKEDLDKEDPRKENSDRGGEERMEKMCILIFNSNRTIYNVPLALL